MFRHMETGLGPSPQHVLGCARPLVIDQVINLPRIEPCAEMLSEEFDVAGLLEHFRVQGAVTTNEQLKDRLRQSGVFLEEMAHESIEVAMWDVTSG